jgi:hypothetical protein
MGDKVIILFALKISEGAKKTDSMQYIFYVFDWQKYIKNFIAINHI